MQVATGTIKAAPVSIDWHQGLSIYASELFLKSVGDEYGWLGGFDSSGRQRCILPYTLVKKAIFRMVRFRVETILLDEELTIEEEKSFLNSVIEYFRSMRADMIIPATTNTIFRTYPTGAIAAPYGSYIIDLSQSEETRLKNMHPKHRNKVRSAMKNGIEICTGMEYLETACNLVRDSFMRSTKGFLGKMNIVNMLKYDTFKHQVESFGENVEVFAALYKGIVQACAVIPFSLHSAYYLHGGSVQDPVPGTMNLLQWEAMKHFSARGVKFYDFVGVRINPEKGSKQEGLMMFKQRFGGKLAQGYMWKYALRPLKYAFYAQAVQYLRGGDIVDNEHFKLDNEETAIHKIK